MNKVFTILLATGLFLFSPVSAFAQVYGQNQVIMPPFGSNGFVVSTSTSPSAKLSATSTPYFSNFYGTNGTIAALSLPNISSALVLTNSSGQTASYAGTSCTNQFVRSLSALGLATCATVGAADVSLANLTATDSTLTFSGTYNGSTARTIGLNLGNANIFTALQTFNGNASSTQLTTTGSAYLATTGGNVGIGTTSPTQILSIAGTAAPTLNFDFTTNTGFTRATFSESSSLKGFLELIGSNFGVANRQGNLELGTATGGGATSLWTNSLERLRIDTSGNVGINQTSPGYKLDVNGTIGVTGKVSFVGTAATANTAWEAINTTTASNWGGFSNTSGYMYTGVEGSSGGSFIVGDSAYDGIIYTASGLAISTNFGSSAAMRINSSGNVGIGTTNPLQKLEVDGSINSNTGTNAGTLTFGPSGGNNVLSSTNSPLTLTINSAGYSNVAIPNGNVGIGTTTPMSLLALESSGATKINVCNGAGTACLGLGFNASGNQAGVFGTETNAGFFLRTNGSNRLAINSNGNIGVATTTPNWPFEIAGTRPSLAISDTGAGGTNLKHWLFSSMGGNLYIGTSTDAYGTSTPAALTILNGGNIGVGTTSPWRTLDVNGTIGIKGITSSAGLQTAVLCQSSNNEMIADSVACLASARRFKRDIIPLASSLNEVMKLTPVSFRFKPEYNGSRQSDPNYNGEQVGFIADDVRKIDPRLVTVETATSTGGISSVPGDVHGVRYENMVALLTKSIQEQQKEIEALQQQVRQIQGNYQVNQCRI